MPNPELRDSEACLMSSLFTIYGTDKEERVIILGVLMFQYVFSECFLEYV